MGLDKPEEACYNITKVKQVKNNMKETKVKKAFGTHEIARVCQVTPPTVIRWMEEGKLVFFTTGGGHRRVWDSDLAAFMRLHNMPVPASIENGNRLKLLIVDDDAEYRAVVVRVLRAAYPEAELDEAADGFEAGHKLHAFRPVLVILDLQLPGVDGFRICRLIRASQELRAIKILAVTGQDIEEAKTEVLGAGADDFLGKPFEIGELGKKLELLLQAAPRRGKEGL